MTAQVLVSVWSGIVPNLIERLEKSCDPRANNLAIGTWLADFNTMLGNLAMGLALTPRQLVKKEAVTKYIMHLAPGFLSSLSVG